MGSFSLAISKLQAEQKNVCLHNSLSNHLKQQILLNETKGYVSLKPKANSRIPFPSPKLLAGTSIKVNVTQMSLRIWLHLEIVPLFSWVTCWKESQLPLQAEAMAKQLISELIQLIKLNQWFGSHQEKGFEIKGLWREALSLVLVERPFDKEVWPFPL